MRTPGIVDKHTDEVNLKSLDINEADLCKLTEDIFNDCIKPDPKLYGFIMRHAIRHNFKYFGLYDVDGVLVDLQHVRHPREREVAGKPDELEFVRADGNTLCPICSLSYIKHSMMKSNNALTVLCDGSLVKL